MQHYTMRSFLTLLFMLIFCGRTGLWLHELLGHGLVALSLGGDVTGVHLFLFGGGWVTYQLTDAPYLAHLLVLTGGVICEIICGVVFILLSFRCSPRIRVYLHLLALILLIHAPAYLCQGVYYGTGDGRIFYQLLQPWHFACAWGGAFITIALTFALSRYFSGTFLSLFANSHLLALRRVIPAAFLAIVFHGLLTFAEVKCFPSGTYTALFTPEYTYEVEKEVQEHITHSPKELTPEEIQSFRNTLLEGYSPFPLEWILLPGIFCALLAGALCSSLKFEGLIIEELLSPSLFLALASLLLLILSGWLLSILL